MIPAGVQVYVASTPVDFRKGATGLMALVRDGGADPFSGALYVFRSKRADRIKAVWLFGLMARGYVCSPRRLRKRSSAGPGLGRPRCG